MQFAAAIVHYQVTDATDHSQQALLLQSTEMSDNVVFIIIDWKSSKWKGTLIRNTN